MNHTTQLCSSYSTQLYTTLHNGFAVYRYHMKEKKMVPLLGWLICLLCQKCLSHHHILSLEITLSSCSRVEIHSLWSHIISITSFWSWIRSNISVESIQNVLLWIILLRVDSTILSMDFHSKQHNSSERVDFYSYTFREKVSHRMLEK